jgi:thioredoxin reductase (NADPH)
MNCFGGQCTFFYPKKEMCGVPGVAGVLASDFVDTLVTQSSCRDNFINEKVTQIRWVDHGFKLNDTYLFNYIILAIGNGSMTPNIPSIVSDVLTENGFVQSCCANIDIYKGKVVVVAGGGDSAADVAIDISKVSGRVFVIHRGEKMTCEAEKFLKLRLAPNVELKLGRNILSVENCEIITNQETLMADHLIFCYGCRASNDLVHELNSIGVEMFDDRVAVDVNTMQTSVAGIFAIGDIARYPNKKRNVISCSFEAYRAVKLIAM